MEGFEEKPARKRKSRAKPAVQEATLSLRSHTVSAPTEEQTGAGTVKGEKKEGDLKISRIRKKKNAEPPPEVSEHIPGIALATAHTVSAAPDLNVGEPQSEGPVTPQKKEALPTATLAQPELDRVANNMAKSQKRDKEGGPIYKLIQQRLFKASVWMINLCSYAIISILLGFSQPITHVPLLDFIESRKLTVLAVLCVVVFLTVVLLLVLQPLQKRLRPMDTRLKAMGAVTLVSSLSCVLCLSLLGTALVRPSWCPTSLCPRPQVITQPITTTQGSHDSNLDVYFIGFQSSTYVIPGNPQKPDYLPASTDPRSIGAVQLNTGATSAPYTIAIGLHSLYTGRYSIIIDKVTLFVMGVNMVRDPLRVYPVVLLTGYSTTHPARFVYQGQQAHQTIRDTYPTSLFRPVELAPGEPDQIDAAVVSGIPVDMHFRIQVTYHIATQGQQTLFLPQTFEVVFSNASNWQTYQLNQAQQNFVPAS
ncbi:MAG: hypothetical protein ACRDIV_17860 [Ktedonobacteraceae bacterium]